MHKRLNSKFSFYQAIKSNFFQLFPKLHLYVNVTFCTSLNMIVDMILVKLGKCLREIKLPNKITYWIWIRLESAVMVCKPSYQINLFDIFLKTLHVHLRVTCGLRIRAHLTFEHFVNVICIWSKFKNFILVR